jgi:hypothetical protein
MICQTCVGDPLAPAETSRSESNSMRNINYAQVHILASETVSFNSLGRESLEVIPSVDPGWIKDSSERR